MHDGGKQTKAPGRLPPWLKRKLPAIGCSHAVSETLRRLNLNTVCQSARCPNTLECYGSGTATFLILGGVCTRRCGFCAVDKGGPSAPDPGEPERLAQAAKEMGLRHVVVTSVTRDDLADGGARHFAETVRELRRMTDATVEVLTPDFRGSSEALKTVLESGPDVFNHNVETVPRLYPKVRPNADFQRSLSLLRAAAAFSKRIAVKSGLMVGLGETREELDETLRSLLDAGCRMVTVGQYLKPREGCLEVARFWYPEEFEVLKKDALAMGFAAVQAGPYVRSSYCAGETLKEIGR